MEERRKMEEEGLLLQLEVQKRKSQQEMELKEVELRQKLMIRRKKGELHIRQQIAEADARENAVRSIEEELIRAEESSRDSQPASLNAEAPIFQPTQRLHSEVNMLTTLPTKKITSPGSTVNRREAQDLAAGAVGAGATKSEASGLIQSAPHPRAPHPATQTPRGCLLDSEVLQSAAHAPVSQRMQTNEAPPEHSQDKSSMEELVTRQNLVMESLMN